MLLERRDMKDVLRKLIQLSISVVRYYDQASRSCVDFLDVSLHLGGGQDVFVGIFRGGKNSRRHHARLLPIGPPDRVAFLYDWNFCQAKCTAPQFQIEMTLISQNEGMSGSIYSQNDGAGLVLRLVRQ